MRAEDVLAGEGFYPMQTNQDWIHVFVRDASPYLYCVVIYDEPDRHQMRAEGTAGFEEGIRKHFQEHAGTTPTLLRILQQEAAPDPSWLQSGYTWWLRTTDQQLLIPEGGLTSFLGLEKAFAAAKNAATRDEAAFSAAGPAYSYGTAERSRIRSGTGIRQGVRKLPLVTIVLIALNILIYVGVEMFADSATYTDRINALALYWPAVFRAGEYYRVLTSMFLHAGPSHLFNNMLVLYAVGERLEAVAGRWRYLLIYILGGIGAGFVSMAFHSYIGEMTMSIGASGAVFAVVGGMLALFVIYRGRIFGMTARRMVMFVFFSLYGGFVNAGTDNVAHIGGVIVGFLITLILMIGKSRGQKKVSAGGR